MSAHLPSAHSAVDNPMDMSPSADPDESLLVLVLRSLIGSMSILGNLLIIAIFMRFPKFRLSHTNGLITLLALSGLVVGSSCLRNIGLSLADALLRAKAPQFQVWVSLLARLPRKLCPVRSPTIGSRAFPLGCRSSSACSSLRPLSWP